MTKDRFIAAAAVAIALAAGGTAAYASIPDSGGVIHGCYAKDGTLRVIDTDAGEACGKNQTALTWNQAGPQGPQGPPGPSGSSPQTVTQDVHYSPDDISQSGHQAYVTVDCPAGKLAINGGVMKSTADADWLAAAATAPQKFHGDAAEVDPPGDGFSPDSLSLDQTQPVNNSIPRPANDGASWVMNVFMHFPLTRTSNPDDHGTHYGMTVTYYAICL